MLANVHEAIGQNLAVMPQMQQLLMDATFPTLNLEHLVMQSKDGDRDGRRSKDGGKGDMMDQFY